MPLRGIRRSTQKSPPILSHEFVIQNHADIVSCLAMLFVIGLMFQVRGMHADALIQYLAATVCTKYNSRGKSPLTHLHLLHR